MIKKIELDVGDRGWHLAPFLVRKKFNQRDSGSPPQGIPTLRRDNSPSAKNNVTIFAPRLITPFPQGVFLLE
ncbi:MAG: hypothetical protein WC508_05915 [Patescibacteria group bacterium]